MADIDFSGLTHDLYFGTKDGKNFKKVLGVSDLEPDNDTETVERKFIDGTGLKIVKNFTSSAKFKITDIGQENLKNIVPGHVYDSGESIDGVTGVTAGTNGAVQVGLKKSSSTQVNGTFKLVPKLASQAKHTIYILNADATLTDWSIEDGLTEYEITVNGQFVEGDITFAS